MEYVYKDIPISEIALIKPLWEKLNQLHLRMSIYFKDHYETFTFEKRMASFQDKDQNDLKITVVLIADQIKGYCMSSISNNMGEIDSLYLEEDTRGAGIGKELVEAHLAWLHDNGCEKIRLTVSYGNDSVLEFYRKMGFYERMIGLEHRAAE